MKKLLQLLICVMLVSAEIMAQSAASQSEANQSAMTQSAMTQSATEELRAVKITDVDSKVLMSDKSIAEAMDYLASIGVNAVLPVVLNGGYTQYPSSVMKRHFNSTIDPEFSGRDPFGRLVIEAHRNGIEVYPWFEYGFSSYYSGGIPPLGGHILNKYPQWALRTKDGKICTKNGFDWMSGANPEVQDFIIDLVKEVTDNYDIDGVEFSDRMPAMPVEGGYDSTTVSLYRKDNNGANPPDNITDEKWMRWRADRLNDFYRRVKDTVKARGSNLFVASSPSQYPWAYYEYLQDSKTWVNEGIIEQFVPQLYRYNYNEYLYELNNAISHIDPSKKGIMHAGILMNVGSYTISPDFLLKALKANRDKGLKGEAFFFYEGLRKNHDQLGDTLKATFYSKPALVPGRGGNTYRPPAVVVNEDDTLRVSLEGKWQKETSTTVGFKPNVLLTNETKEGTSINYSIDVPFDAWFSVYCFVQNGAVNTTKAHYTLLGEEQSVETYIDQYSAKNRGWQKLGDVYLKKGLKKVVTLDNKGLQEGKYITADAVMIMINRKLSPDVTTGVEGWENARAESKGRPEGYCLAQNYPNPFNPQTTITFSLPEASRVSLKVYDVLGREKNVLINGRLNEGVHSVDFNASGLPSGIYFYELRTDRFVDVKKMMVVK